MCDLVDSVAYLKIAKTVSFKSSYCTLTHTERKKEKLKSFLLIPSTRQRCPFSVFLFNIVLEVLTRAIRQEKEEKKKKNSIQIRKKEVKSSPFANDIIWIEHPQRLIKKLLELINEFGKVAQYKFYSPKSIVSVYKQQTT